MIEEVEVVKEAEKALPFLCPICKQIDVAKEYLRFFLSGQVNPLCIHSSCALNCLKEEAEEYQDGKRKN